MAGCRWIFLNFKTDILFLGGILNYVSHIMYNAVNYLTTNRPLNLTLYCRHDIEVNCIQYKKRSYEEFLKLASSLKIVPEPTNRYKYRKLFVRSLSFPACKFKPVVLGKSTTYGEYRNHNHGLFRANADGFYFFERFRDIQTQYSSDSTDGSFMYT